MEWPAHLPLEGGGGVSYQARYLLCSGSSKLVPIRSRSRTLDNSETYTQVFKENEGLYVGVFQ